MVVGLYPLRKSMGEEMIEGPQIDSEPRTVRPEDRDSMQIWQEEGWQDQWGSESPFQRNPNSKSRCCFHPIPHLEHQRLLRTNQDLHLLALLKFQNTLPGPTLPGVLGVASLVFVGFTLLILNIRASLVSAREGRDQGCEDGLGCRVGQTLRGPVHGTDYRVLILN